MPEIEHMKKIGHLSALGLTVASFAQMGVKKNPTYLAGGLGTVYLANLIGHNLYGMPLPPPFRAASS